MQKIKSGIRSAYEKSAEYAALSEALINERVEGFLLGAKIIIVLFTVVWAVLWIVSTILTSRAKKTTVTPAQQAEAQKVMKVLNGINDFLFYAIVVLVIVVCFLIMFMFRGQASYVLKSSWEYLRGHLKDIATDTAPVPRYYLSLTVWMMLYFIVIGFVIIVVKATNNVQALYTVT
jgi:hypothetical protein